MNKFAVIAVTRTLGNNYESRKNIYGPIVKWLSENSYITNKKKEYMNYIGEKDYVLFSDEINETGITILRKCLDKHISSVFRSKRKIDDMFLFDKAKEKLDNI